MKTEHIDMNLNIEIQMPEWVTKEQIVAGVETLSEVLTFLRTHPDRDGAMRGYLTAAMHDGFLVRPSAVRVRDLEKTCIRAFWYAFEKIVHGEYLPSEVQH